MKTTTKYTYQRKVMLLAKQLLAGNYGTWKECLKYAHEALRTVHTKLITFVKIKTGEITTRVVARWDEFNVLQGTGNKVKEGLRLFADMAKVLLCKPVNTISTYKENIIELI